VRLPLERIRVLDVTQIWAGPYATRLLGDMGAEVIKVESIQRPDPERMAVGPRRSWLYPGFEPADRYFDRKAEFVEYNRNKYGMTLSLVDPRGVAAFKELVKISDVVIENFAVGVMKRFGLDYEDLRKIRPDIVMVSVAAFGRTGPESAYRGYGPLQEALAGLASITGYTDGVPLELREYYGDPTAGLFAASAVLAALWHRSRTGQGALVDISQRECVAAMLPELMLEHTMNQRTLQPIGNLHRGMAPHNCYPCKGEDNWITIAVRSDAEWRALCDVMGAPEHAEDPRFATRAQRLEHRDALEALVGEWTITQENQALMHQLQGKKIAAAAVLTPPDVLQNPQYKAREFLPMVPHAEAGTYPQTGMPWKFSGIPNDIRMPSPLLGEHNRLILGDFLGKSAEEIAELEGAGVIGDRPAHGPA